MGASPKRYCGSAPSPASDAVTTTTCPLDSLAVLSSSNTRSPRSAGDTTAASRTLGALRGGGCVALTIMKKPVELKAPGSFSYPRSSRSCVVGQGGVGVKSVRR
eukprot:352683-Chlamydomonas_euryale.AAC.4